MLPNYVEKAYLGTRPLSKALSERELGYIFKQYDKNGDGRLDKDELKQAFKRLGALIPGWRASRALHFADANGDGFISQEEMDALIKYAVQLGYKIE